MRNIINVTFNLDRIRCYDEGDGWGDAEPYLWTVFFKIDGNTCRLNDSLMLEGTATLFTTPGSHGNLGDSDVEEGETVLIPRAIGLQEMLLTPIPVPEFVRQLGVNDVTAIAGCVVVLMEEDNVSDDGAEAGHQALNVAIQDALDGLIPTLGFSNQSISDDDIEALMSQIENRVADAVKSQQNFFEDLWSWLNKDDTIGTVVWKFSGDELLAQNPVNLQQRWRNEGDWELFGSIESAEIPSCPADVVREIFEAIFGSSTSESTMQALYGFRDNDLKKKYIGMLSWWNLARRNSHYLKQALQDGETAQAAATLFKDIPSILKNRNEPLSEKHFECGMKILIKISNLVTEKRQPRKDIKRSIDALALLEGKTPNQIFEALSRIKPARYPQTDPIS